MTASRTLLIVLGLALSLISAGCLVTGNSRQTRSGNYVADSTFNQIQPGKTTEGWVRATLGPPTSKDRLSDGTEIWKYSYTERRESSGAVFLIFGGHDEKEINGTAYVEIKNGVVTNAWRG